MRPTRRYWTVAGAAGFLAVLAVLATRPLLLFGAATIGAALLAHQYRFLRQLEATDRGLSVTQELARQYVHQDDETPVVLEAGVASATPLTIAVEASPPVSASAPPSSDRRLVLAGDSPAQTTFSVTWPVAGRATFDSPVVTLSDAAGFFRETVHRGPTPTVTVEPRAPRNLHVGEGGEQIPVAAGEHRAGTYGAGLDPAELRPYTVGDDASDIDWKATARLADPYVREYEAETDRRSALLVDHRETLGVGPPGQTKLDYLREVALALVDQAQAFEDPLGCYTVDEAGLTSEYRPNTASDQYRAVKTALHELSASPPAASGDEAALSTSGAATSVASGGHGSAIGGVAGGHDDSSHRVDPAAASVKAARLGSDESVYGETVRPFFADRRGYVQRFDRDPLFATAKGHLRTLGGPLWTFLFTDDEHPAEVREAVKLLRGGTGHVAVFLAPAVLFEPGSLADLESAYGRYVEFEEFRRELAHLERVSAYEVGPGDRLDAILEDGRGDSP